jgi:hypothetical protein
MDLDLSRVKVMYPIPAGDGWAMVIGDPANGWYEWAHVKCCGRVYLDERGNVPCLESEEVWSSSNEVYGSPTGALIAILFKLEGGECTNCGCCVSAEDFDLRCHHCRSPFATRPSPRGDRD